MLFFYTMENLSRHVNKPDNLSMGGAGNKSKNTKNNVLTGKHTVNT